MQALGNDFIVINNLAKKIEVARLPIQQLAHRQLGIGFDQLLIIEPSTQGDFLCRIFNADGNEVEQCGNGLRCVAKYINDYALTSKKNFFLETKAGTFNTDISSLELIKISLGEPNFIPEKIPVMLPAAEIYSLEINSQIITGNILSLGNPHFITQVKTLSNIPAQELGFAISTAKVFPKQTNVGFMEIISPSHVRLQTYERGVGLTQACGSNACAAVIAGIMTHDLDNKVTVELALGNLEVEWPEKNGPVFLTGPAVKVFEGTITS